MYTEFLVYVEYLRFDGVGVNSVLFGVDMC
jgi:hypothetical protein